MTSYLVMSINGKEVRMPVELTEEQAKEILVLREEEGKKTGWEKPETGNMYYYEDALCRVQAMLFNESSKIQLEMLYNAANCYSSERLANDLSRGDTLIKKLRRFAVENRKTPIDFNNLGGYTITYNYKNKCLECGMTGNWMTLGDIVFDTEETAREAINKFASELVWYFTEMRDTL